MKKLAILALSAFTIGLGGCTYDVSFEKDYEYELVVPVSASGTGQVEDIILQDIDLEQAIADETGKASFSDVTSIKIKEARIQLDNADNENNAANFSKATIEISKEDGSAKVSGSADIADEFSSSVNLDNAFGDQDLKPAIESKKLRYKVVFDARRSTNKELTGKLKVKLMVNLTINEMSFY